MPLGYKVIREGGSSAKIHESGDLPGQLVPPSMERPGLFCIFQKVFTFGKPGFLAEETGFSIYLLLPSMFFIFTRSQ
jgi:hypothetical protein